MAESPQALKMPQASLELAEPMQWLRSRPVLVIGVLLIAADMWWKAEFLAKSFFRYDDYLYLEHAATEPLSWNYLFWVDGGHLDVVGSAIAWATQRLSPYDWTLDSAVTLVLLAVTCLALLRMLRTLFGDRPGILLILALYLLSPLALPGLTWWTVTLEQLPLQLALFCAVTAHVHYLRTGKYWHAVVAVIWLAVGMLTSFQGAAGVLVLFALTSAFFAVGSWPLALWPTLRTHWRAWLLYVVVTAAYLPLYLIRLKTSTIGVTKPPTFSFVLNFAGLLLRDTFLPGAFGGPWRWAYSGVSTLASPPSTLAWISWALAILVLLTSLTYAWDAWRAWVILAAWFVLVDVVPVIAGRSTYIASAVLGLSARYVWDGAAVLALCLGLAFLPIIGSPRPQRQHRRLGRTEFAAATTLIVAIVFGAIWSYADYPNDPSVATGRSYLATAQTALAGVPSGTVIFDNAAPPAVTGGIAGPADMASAVLSPLEVGPAASRPKFVTQPDGTYNHLMEFNVFGQLVPALPFGASSGQPPAADGSCWPASNGTVTVPLQAMATDASTLRIGYIGSGNGQLLVTFGSQSVQYNSSGGLNSAFLPANGASAQAVTIQAISGTLPCVGDVEAGAVGIAPGTAIPAFAVSG